MVMRVLIRLQPTGKVELTSRGRAEHKDDEAYVASWQMFAVRSVPDLRFK